MGLVPLPTGIQLVPLRTVRPAVVTRIRRREQDSPFLLHHDGLFGQANCHLPQFARQRVMKAWGWSWITPPAMTLLCIRYIAQTYAHHSSLH
jgi:hypothetical protein